MKEGAASIRSLFCILENQLELLGLFFPDIIENLIEEAMRVLRSSMSSRSENVVKHWEIAMIDSLSCGVNDRLERG